MTPHALTASAGPHSRLLAWGPFIAVAALLSILWALVIGFAVVQERRIVDGAGQQIRLINNAAAQQTRDLLRSADNRLDVVQQWLARMPPTEADAALGELLQSFGRHSGGLMEVNLVDARGSALALLGTPAWAAEMPAVVLPASAGELRVGDPLRSAPGKPWRWPLTRRLPTPSGPAAGVVAWVDLALLSAVHERLREQPAGGISVVLPSGMVVLRTPYTEHLIGRTVTAVTGRARPLPPGVTQGSFEYDGTAIGGQARVGTYERLAEYPVTVLVSQERNELLSAFRARRDIGIGVLLAITACGAVFSWLLARSQREARRSQAQFEAVSNAFPLGLFMTDTRGETTYANDAYFQKLGLDRARMPWGWSELLDASTRDQAVAGWREATRSGTALRNVLHVTRPDGRPAVLSVHTAPLTVDGRLLGLVGSMEDVTDRAQQQRAQRMLTAIFEKSTDIVAQVGVDGQMLYLNPAGRALLQIAPGDPIEHLRFDDFVPAHREAQVRDVIVPTAVATGLWLGETSVLAGDGREVDVSEMLIVHRDDRQEIETYSVVMRDITESTHSRTELQRSESILKVVAATLPVLVAVADRDQRYLFTNDAFARRVGRPHGRLAGLHAREVLGDAEYEHRRPHIEAALTGQRVMFEAASGDGHYFEVSYIPFRDAEGAVAGLVAVTHDITSHKRQHQILLDASQTDPLTGALNRAGFDLRVSEALEQAHADHHPLALLMVDLDRFKPVNDEHGHAAGDALLVAVAKRLQHVLRPTDLLARLGGDEFAVVLPDVKDEAAARTVARKIVATLGESFDEVEGLRLSIGASVGLALAHNGRDTVASLSRRADVALYQAKRAGRGRFEVAPAEG